MNFLNRGLFHARLSSASFVSSEFLRMLVFSRSHALRLFFNRLGRRVTDVPTAIKTIYCLHSPQTGVLIKKV